MAAHRAWRVKYDSNYGSPSRETCCASEIEFRESFGGADVTDGAPGTAIASSNDGTWSNGIAAAFDNNNGTIWHDASTGSSTAWIGWDFGSNPADWPDVVEFLFRARSGGYSDDDSIKEGGLEWTDDDPSGAATWTRLFSIATQPPFGDNEARVFSYLLALTSPTECDYTGDWETFVVPSGATELSFKMWGGAGHGGRYSGGKWGGGGAYVSGTFPVSPGDVIAVQVAQGGYDANHPTYPRQGGYPDGGTGSYGDVGGGGGGGSSRIWKDGVLMAVAAGGAGAAGYSGNGGPGGHFTGGGNSTNGDNGATSAGPGGPRGFRSGQPIWQDSPTRRTGGWGGAYGAGTDEDGGGGGGGYFGGGGGGGDGRAGGGGLSWVHASVTGEVAFAGSGSNPGGTSDPDYPGAPIGYGAQSNQANSGGDGAVRMSLDSGTLGPGGSPPNAPWASMYDRPPQINDTGNRQNDTVRCRINADALNGAHLGSTIRVLMRGGSGGTRIGRFFVAVQDPSNTIGYSNQSDGPFYQVFWDGGSASKVLGEHEFAWSDPVEFPHDGTNPILLSMWCDNGGTSTIYRSFDSGGVGWMYRENVDNADTTGTVPYTYGWYHHWVEGLDVLIGSLDPGGEPVVRRRLIINN